MSSESPQIVEINLERLQRLEQLEASLPQLIEAGVKQYKQAKLKSLHERDKLNPDAANMRARRYAEKHRDEINARRREKRRLAKETIISAPTPQKQPTQKVISNSAPLTPQLLPLEITEAGILVRFDI